MCVYLSSIHVCVHATNILILYVSVHTRLYAFVLVLCLHIILVSVMVDRKDSEWWLKVPL